MELTGIIFQISKDKKQEIMVWLCASSKTTKSKKPK